MICYTEFDLLVVILGLLTGVCGQLKMDSVQIKQDPACRGLLTGAS
jgi:hypothetical protein